MVCLPVSLIQCPSKESVTDYNCAVTDLPVADPPPVTRSTGTAAAKPVAPPVEVNSTQTTTEPEVS